MIKPIQCALLLTVCTGLTGCKPGSSNNTESPVEIRRIFDDLMAQKFLVVSRSAYLSHQALLINSEAFVELKIDSPEFDENTLPNGSAWNQEQRRVTVRGTFPSRIWLGQAWGEWQRDQVTFVLIKNAGVWNLEVHHLLFPESNGYSTLSWSFPSETFLRRAGVDFSGRQNGSSAGADERSPQPTTVAPRISPGLAQVESASVLHHASSKPRVLERRLEDERSQLSAGANALVSQLIRALETGQLESLEYLFRDGCSYFRIARADWGEVRHDLEDFIERFPYRDYTVGESCELLGPIDGEYRVLQRYQLLARDRANGLTSGTYVLTLRVKFANGRVNRIRSFEQRLDGGNG